MNNTVYLLNNDRGGNMIADKARMMRKRKKHPSIWHSFSIDKTVLQSSVSNNCHLKKILVNQNIKLKPANMGFNVRFYFYDGRFSYMHKTRNGYPNFRKCGRGLGYSRDFRQIAKNHWSFFDYIK